MSKRKRGVQASREKLTSALIDAGLDTQAALSQRIADLENLDTVPRDMVSRAFRELPVEARSIERIARALGVRPSDLYLLQETAGLTKVATSANLVSGKVESGWRSVVVPPVLDDPSAVLASAVRDALRPDYRVAASTAVSSPPPHDLSGISARLGVDVVLELVIETQYRLTAVRAYAYADGVRTLIWSESLPRILLQEQAGKIAERIKRALNFAKGRGDPVPHFPSETVQDDYLLGEFFLDEPSNELNLRRAEGHLNAAIRKDPEFAKAHATLCQTLLEAHWVLDENRMLSDAEIACERAMELDPDDPVTQMARAHLLRRGGDREEGLKLYLNIVAAQPKDTAAHTGLAATWLDVYRETESRDALEAAKRAYQTAAELDELQWKPLFHVALIEWFADDLKAAIAASKSALERQENEYILANLGSFYVCSGEFQAAREVYERAQKIAPDSYVGSEFLGLVHYFLGNYEEAIRLRRIAIENIATGSPEIHEMWGYLGDALRMNDEIAESVEAYTRAAEISERDYLRGNMPIADQAARAYYYTILRHLDRSTVSDAVDSEIAHMLPNIDEAQFEASAHRRMAQTWLLRGEEERAIESLRRATEKCPGYGQVPDLKQLMERL